MSTIDAAAEPSYDVIVIGGGPAGSTTATLLTQAKLKVAVFEREAFPRFHVGESLLPANLPLFERLGCHEALRQAGFLVKPGATFYDEYEGRGHNSFAFQATDFHPAFAYNVVRAQFDNLLLRHAAQVGAAVYWQHEVQQTAMTSDAVSVMVRTPQSPARSVQARFLVDASGRSALLGSRLGQRHPLPHLGKVALFAHFRGARRDPAIPVGNIRIYLVREGWLWWIPFADGTDSLGCVLHAKVVKARQGTTTDLFEEVWTSSSHLRQGFATAQRITPVHTAANFSYRVQPVVGHRYIAVGDASGFVDPIFSAGVYMAMRSGELAAQTIIAAFQRQDFRPCRLRAYAVQLRRNSAPYISMVKHFYEPAFLDLFFAPHPPRRLYRAVLAVLSGMAFDRRPLEWQINLRLFFLCVKVRKIIRWLTGLPSASRRSW